MTSSEKYEPIAERRSRQMTIRGVRYHLTEWGEEASPLVVYLHGWGDTGSTFQFVADVLASTWRIVAPDWRGFGRSGHAGESYWFPDYLADLDALLDRLSPGAPARIAGHSMGANVAGLYAGIMPERVIGFVNIEGFGLADSDPSDAPANYRRWIERGRSPEPYRSYESYADLAARLRKRHPGLPAGRADFVAREWGRLDADGRVRLRADPRHRLPNAVLYRRAEAVACWDRVAADVLLVAGEQTDFTSAVKSWIDPDPAGRPFHGAATVTIPSAGHMVHFDAPDALAHEIERFLHRQL